MDASSRRFTIRLSFFIGWLALAWLSLRLSPFWGLGLDLEAWHGQLSSVEPGALVYLTFIAIYVAGCLICFPTAVLGITAGFLFGTWVALICVVAGCTIGATLSFIIGRYVGREFFEEQARGLVARLDSFISGMGWKAVLSARLAFVPFAPSNYVCGVLKVSYKHFIVGTVLGILPGSWAACYLGSGLEILALGDGDIPWIPVACRLALALAIIIWSLQSDEIKTLRQK